MSNGVVQETWSRSFERMIHSSVEASFKKTYFEGNIRLEVRVRLSTDLLGDDVFHRRRGIPISTK